MTRRRKKKNRLSGLLFWIVMGLFAGLAIDRIEVGLVVGTIAGLIFFVGGIRSARGAGSSYATGATRDTIDLPNDDENNDEDDDVDDDDDGWDDDGWDDSGDSDGSDD